MIQEAFLATYFSYDYSFNVDAVDLLWHLGILVPVIAFVWWLLSGEGSEPEGEDEGTQGTEEGTEEVVGGPQTPSATIPVGNPPEDDGTDEGTEDGEEEGTEEGTGTDVEKPAGTCGPDVTKELVGVLTTVMEDYKKLPWYKRAGQCLGMGLWNIDPLRDALSTIMPPDCGCPKSTPCDATVMCYGKCVPAGILNYTIYGVIEVLCGARLTGALLHGLYWAGKFVAGKVSLGYLSGTTLHVGVYESFMVSVGKEFADGGPAAMEAQMQKIPGEPCGPCSQPPKRHQWKYTWFPEYPNEPSKH